MRVCTEPPFFGWLEFTKDVPAKYRTGPVIKIKKTRLDPAFSIKLSNAPTKEERQKEKDANVAEILYEIRKIRVLSQDNG